jgi:hypothetical protein
VKYFYARLAMSRWWNLPHKYRKSSKKTPYCVTQRACSRIAVGIKKIRYAVYRAQITLCKKFAECYVLYIKIERSLSIYVIDTAIALECVFFSREAEVR